MMSPAIVTVWTLIMSFDSKNVAIVDNLTDVKECHDVARDIRKHLQYDPSDSNTPTLRILCEKVDKVMAPVVLSGSEIRVAPQVYNIPPPPAPIIVQKPPEPPPNQNR